MPWLDLNNVLWKFPQLVQSYFLTTLWYVCVCMYVWETRISWIDEERGGELGVECILLIQSYVCIFWMFLSLYDMFLGFILYRVVIFQ